MATAKNKNTNTKPAADKATADKKPSSSGGSRKSVKLSAIVNRVATSKEIDATVAGKRTRAYIRRNRENLVKAGWKELSNHDKGNRYGDVPASAAKVILEALTK